MSYNVKFFNDANSTAGSVILNAEPSRVGIVFFSYGAGDVLITPKGAPSAARGFSLNIDWRYVQLLKCDVGDLVTAEWTLIDAMAPGISLTIYEIYDDSPSEE